LHAQRSARWGGGGGGAPAVDDVERAGREAGGSRERSEGQRRGRRELRRLQHDRAAGGQRGGGLLRGHEERVVPRGNCGDDAHGDVEEGGAEAMGAVRDVFLGWLLLRDVGVVSEHGWVGRDSVSSEALSVSVGLPRPAASSTSSLESVRSFPQFAVSAPASCSEFSTILIAMSRKIFDRYEGVRVDHAFELKQAAADSTAMSNILSEASGHVPAILPVAGLIKSKYALSFTQCPSMK
jgi:hypothetical protein